MDVKISSSRGKEKYSYDGYLYNLDKRSKRDVNVIFWRCEQIGRCKARLHTRDGEVIKTLNNHSHDSSAANVEAALVVTNIKRRAVTSVEHTAQVINECVTDLSQATQAAIPNCQALRKLIRRKRKEINAAPVDPSVINDLVIPDEFRIYIPRPGISEKFLLFDSGPNNGNRFLIFGKESWLQHLSNCIWFCDGTFSITPKFFSQVYVILVKRLGGVHPVLYVLLPNKQNRVYVQMFEAIKSLVPNINPVAVNCDFEQAAISAIKECFPGVPINGCFFHLAKNMKKQVAEMGFTSRYNNDPDFALYAKMVIALAFVPIADLDECIEVLGEVLPNELQRLLNWLEDNYIGRQNRRGNGRRPALFPAEIWNLHTRVLNQDDRTNNHAEAAHRRLQSELGVAHPTIWALIMGLRKVQKSRDLYYEQLVAGNLPPVKLKKYRQADERIFRIVSDYRNRTKLDYLRGLAYNYQF